VDVKKFVFWGIGGAVALALLAIVVIFALQSGGGERDTTAQKEEEAPGAAQGGQEEAEPPRQKVDTQSFEGTERNAEPRFKAAGGLAIFRLTHAGRQNFVVQVGQGANVTSLIVNTVGDFDGSKAVGLAPGDYTMKIRSSGRWTVEIDQPIPGSAPSAPQKLSGDGQTATSFFRLRAGNANFRMGHQADGIFAPYLVKADGTPLTLLANEVKRFSGSKQIVIPEDGVYLIDVTATDRWTIDVSQ
jgi:hypothetical protein